MRIILFVLTLILAPLAAAAQVNPFCEEAWVTRNILFDRAGHCFSSTSGQQLFDNANCVAANPAMSVPDTEAVAYIRSLETETGCAIDTSRAPSANMRAIHARLAALVTVPVPDGLGSGCIGYGGGPVALYRGATTTAGPIGTVTAGQTVVFEHIPVLGWDYVTVRAVSGGAVVAHGWLAPGSFNDAFCAQFAG
jgi:hypothetical protein